jgi:hypothetical protein
LSLVHEKATQKTNAGVIGEARGIIILLGETKTAIARAYIKVLSDISALV